MPVVVAGRTLVKAAVKSQCKGRLPIPNPNLACGKHFVTILTAAYAEPPGMSRIAKLDRARSGSFADDRWNHTSHEKRPTGVREFVRREAGRRGEETQHMPAAPCA